MPPKGIFKGQVFALSGRLSQPQKEYEELIRKHGGEIASSLTMAVTFLVSTVDDVKAVSLKVATAQGRGLPIVQEGFVGACIAAKKLLDPNFFQIKAAVAKRKKPKAKAKAAGAAAASSGGADAEGPVAKKAKVSTTVVATSSTAVVIAKSGMADKAAVLQEAVSKGFVKASLCWDVELVLNDLASGKDRYYNMQLLCGTADDTKGQFWAVQHFGRTGLEGRVHIDGPFDDVDDAKKVFRKKYRQKTGNVWGQLGGTFVETAGKYKLLVRETEEEAKAKKDAKARWQYYLHKAQDGKEIGWYDYDEEAGGNMEKYWRQHETNEGLTVRFVQTSYFKYEINFTEMFQTNVKTGTRRVIRRVADGERPSDDPPAEIPAAVPPKKVEEEDDEEEEEDEELDHEEEEEEEEEEAVAGEAEDDAATEPGGEEAGKAEAEAEAASPVKQEPAGGGRKAAPAGRAAPPAADDAKVMDPSKSDTLTMVDTMAETLPFGKPRGS